MDDSETHNGSAVVIGSCKGGTRAASRDDCVDAQRCKASTLKFIESLTMEVKVTDPQKVEGGESSSWRAGTYLSWSQLPPYRAATFF